MFIPVFYAAFGTERIVHGNAILFFLNGASLTKQDNELRIARGLFFPKPLTYKRAARISCSVSNTKFTGITRALSLLVSLEGSDFKRQSSFKQVTQQFEVYLGTTKSRVEIIILSALIARGHDSLF